MSPSLSNTATPLSSVGLLAKFTYSTETVNNVLHQPSTIELRTNRFARFTQSSSPALIAFNVSSEYGPNEIPLALHFAPTRSEHHAPRQPAQQTYDPASIDMCAYTVTLATGNPSSSTTRITGWDGKGRPSTTFDAKLGPGGVTTVSVAGTTCSVWT